VEDFRTIIFYCIVVRTELQLLDGIAKDDNPSDSKVSSDAVFNIIKPFELRRRMQLTGYLK